MSDAFRPHVGVILGSGLGAVADAVEDPQVIGYGELPGLPAPDRRRATPVRSFRAMIAGVPVAVLQGRAHLYEGGPIDELRAPVRWLKAAGAEILVQTNAAGSLRPEVGPGQPDGDHRPHQPDRHQRADRPERRQHRPALSADGQRL